MVTAIASDKKTGIIQMMFPRIQYITFLWVLARLFPLKQTLGFFFNALQTSPKTTMAHLQNSLFIFMAFHVTLLLNKDLVVEEANTAVSGGASYKQIGYGMGNGSSYKYQRQFCYNQ